MTGETTGGVLIWVGIDVGWTVVFAGVVVTAFVVACVGTLEPCGVTYHMNIGSFYKYGKRGFSLVSVCCGVEQNPLDPIHRDKQTCNRESLWCSLADRE